MAWCMWPWLEVELSEGFFWGGEVLCGGGKLASRNSSLGHTTGFSS